jgi:hypothetical protein
MWTALDTMWCPDVVLLAAGQPKFQFDPQNHAYEDVVSFVVVMTFFFFLVHCFKQNILSLY